MDIDTIDILANRLRNKVGYVSQAQTNAIVHHERAEANYCGVYKKALLDVLIEIENVKEEYNSHFTNKHT